MTNDQLRQLGYSRDSGKILLDGRAVDTQILGGTSRFAGYASDNGLEYAETLPEQRVARVATDRYDTDSGGLIYEDVDLSTIDPSRTGMIHSLGVNGDLSTKFQELGIDKSVGSGKKGFESYDLIRDSDTVNMVARMSPEALMQMQTANGIDAPTAKANIDKLYANRSTLIADTQDGSVQNKFKELFGNDSVDAVKRQIWKPIYTPNQENEVFVDEVTGFRRDTIPRLMTSPTDADGLSKYGGYKDYSKLKWDKDIGLYNPNDEAGYFRGKESISVLGVVASLVAAYFTGGATLTALGPMLSGALSGAIAGGGVASATNGDPLKGMVTGAVTGGVGGAVGGAVGDMAQAADITGWQKDLLTGAAKGVTSSVLSGDDPLKGGAVGAAKGVGNGLINSIWKANA